MLSNSLPLPPAPLSPSLTLPMDGEGRGGGGEGSGVRGNHIELTLQGSSQNEEVGWAGHSSERFTRPIQSEMVLQELLKDK